MPALIPSYFHKTASRRIKVRAEVWLRPAAHPCRRHGAALPQKTCGGSAASSPSLSAKIRREALIKPSRFNFGLISTSLAERTNMVCSAPKLLRLTGICPPLAARGIRRDSSYSDRRCPLIRVPAAFPRWHGCGQPPRGQASAPDRRNTGAPDPRQRLHSCRRCHAAMHRALPCCAGSAP